MTDFYTCNAIIESATIGLDRGSFLCPWVYLKFEFGSQGFGGFVCGGTPDAKAGDHRNQKNLAAEFIVRVLSAAGVERWDQLAGKSVRVRKDKDEWGMIEEIGHIIRDDRWFNPRKTFDDWNGVKS